MKTLPPRAVPQRTLPLVALALAALPVLAALHLSLGAVPVSLGMVWLSLTDPAAAGFAGTTVTVQRLPRLMVAIFSGATLALAGLVLQKALRNLLVSPSTLGLNAGATLGMVLSLWLPGAALRGSVLPALVGACAALAATLALSRALAGQGDRRLDLVMAGSMIALLSSSATTFVISLDPDAFGDLMGWLVGDIGAFDHRAIPAVLPIAVAATLILLALDRRLDILTGGSDQAALLGISPGPLLAAVLGGAVALSVAAVTVVGPIGFVGLIVPNLTRLLMGETGRPAFVFTAAAGADLLIAADLIARTVAAPRLLHVGTVMALAGGLGFFVLILLQRRRAA